MSLEWLSPCGTIDLWLQHTQTQACCQEGRRWSNMYNWWSWVWHCCVMWSGAGVSVALDCVCLWDGQGCVLEDRAKWAGGLWCKRTDLLLGLCIFDALEWCVFHLCQPSWVTRGRTKAYFVMGFYLEGPYFHSHAQLLWENGCQSVRWMLYLIHFYYVSLKEQNRELHTGNLSYTFVTAIYVHGHLCFCVYYIKDLWHIFQMTIRCSTIYTTTFTHNMDCFSCTCTLYLLFPMFFVSGLMVCFVVAQWLCV